MRFESYFKKCKNKQPEKPLSINELKDAFLSLDINKSPGFDDISFTVLKNYFGALHKPLLHVFNLSIIKGICPDDLKIAHVTPVFKEVMIKNLATIDQYQFYFAFLKS